MKINFIDIIVILVYFVSQVAIGLYVGRKNTSTNQYFLAGKSYSGLLVGISFIGSVISSVTFMATPADAFKTAWFRVIPAFAFPMVTVFAAWFLVPFFRRGTITSAYQYLSLRFGNSISTYASVVFLVTQLLRTSMIAYLLALLVGEMTEWGFTASLLLVVLVTALYTVKGGLPAVIWTDAIQAIILLTGAFACILVVYFQLPDGWSGFFKDIVAHHKISFYDYDPSVGGLVPSKWIGGLGEKTVLMIFLVGLMQWLNLQFDQSTVQRWCSSKSAADARKSMYILGIGCVPVWVLFQFLGTCLFVFFLYHSDSVASAILAGQEKAERIMPHFIMHYLPVGVVGLVISAALAAAMSTLSATINVSSMVFTQDIYKKYINRNASDRHLLILGKSSALVVALLMVGGALLIHSLDVITLTDFVLAATVIITLGIPAIFFAGMFTRRVGLRTMWLAFLLPLPLMIWIILSNNNVVPDSMALRIPAYYVSVLGNLSSFLLALILSRFIKPEDRDLTNLTVWSQDSKALE